MRRREFLFGIAALLGTRFPAAAARAATRPGTSLAAAWQLATGYQVGVLSQDPAGALRIAAALDVPTRAHGLLREPNGTLLAVARRPGDWMLRWHRSGRVVAWCWIEPRRAFCGHVVESTDGRTLYTSEMDMDSGVGLIGVRDAASMEKRAEWPTHGIDTHELAWDVMHPGHLIVANGGVPTRPETGRAKLDLEHMDSSLVRLDARNGALEGQWRLDDRRLSLRHLAWGRAADGPVMGIALQAEHDAVGARASAPVLAVFDGRSLRTASAPVPLAGYGGDVAALGSHFAVSCPRAQGVTLHDTNGTWRGLVSLTEACALVSTPGGIWAGGRNGSVAWTARRYAADAARGSCTEHSLPDIRLDNHWIAI